MDFSLLFWMEALQSHCYQNEVRYFITIIGSDDVFSPPYLPGSRARSARIRIRLARKRP